MSTEDILFLRRRSGVVEPLRVADADWPPPKHKPEHHNHHAPSLCMGCKTPLNGYGKKNKRRCSICETDHTSERLIKQCL